MSQTAVLVLAMLLLSACRSAPPPPGAAATHPLIGTSWLAEDLDERGVVARVQSTLTFDSAERVSGRAGCNGYFGRVGLEVSNIAISKVGSTKMACPPAVMDQERRFLEALQAASSWDRDGDILLIFDGERRQRLRLSRLYPARGAAGDTPMVAAPPAPTAVLNALGHEPGWTLELLPERMVFVTAHGAERTPTSRPEARPGTAAGETEYVAVTEGHGRTVRVRIRDTRCVDSLSGLAYPTTVEVVLDGKPYRGCGQWLR
jgi:heat shock protein HslJ/uncharacterized membrane protein